MATPSLTAGSLARSSRSRTSTRAGAATAVRPRVPRALGVLALVVMAALWLVPLLWAVVTAFKSEDQAAALPVRWVPEGGFTIESFARVLTTSSLPLWLFNSTLVAVAVTVITVAVSALAAYGFSRTVFRGRRWLFALTIAAIMVPPQILIVPLFRQMLALDLVDTYWGIILPQVVAPVMVFVLKQFFDAVPVELEEAARMDGAGMFRTFWSVVLPLSGSVIAAVSIFVFIGAWNNFLWPFIVTNDPALMTMPVGLNVVQDAYGVTFAADMAGATVAMLPLLIVFILFQRHIIRGVATTGLGGQ
ncbi:carbohydrate ABC transporter permease [Quadrisphaera sp. DSM 44207]|uniref:carbohydrate ABC transporter permease n=1 Tax=Quadrisphaera sp. DSM 44207 TaxID=1881057 RepID=UPI00088F24B4|nr:carbohydrate ABC transporter permease [Quadrisphaera sp. DSM 44207]SDQ34740.1 carbohydrate ABC transporter membrane protein 2, CUT1 family [Quadrisphaera sp. DSM 44207]